MNKKDFRYNILNQLENNFNIRICFNIGNIRNDNNMNCKKVEKCESCNGCIGSSFYNSYKKSICIKWQNNLLDTIITLFHELAHTQLHGYSRNHVQNKCYEEVEAETFAKLMCKKLNLNYNSGFYESPDINFIDYFWIMYLEECKKENIKPTEIRRGLIKDLVEKVCNLNIDWGDIDGKN